MCKLTVFHCARVPFIGSPELPCRVAIQTCISDRAHEDVAIRSACIES